MRKGLSANQLKTIAIIAMAIDHLAWTLWPGYSKEWYVILFHILGRITAPIMWFFIAEGYRHTRSVKQYAKRLFLLAVISHFAYNFCFGIPFIPFQTSIFNQTSVGWSLAWGLVLLYILDQKQSSAFTQTILILLVCVITFPSDWSCIAAMAVVFIGSNSGHFSKQMMWMMLWTGVYAIVYYVFLDHTYGWIQLCTFLSIPLLKMYNGSRGKWKGFGRFFYIFYPAHLFLLGILRIILQKQI